MTLDAEVLLQAVHDVAMIRRFEERAERLFYEGVIRGSVHLGIGQELVAVAAVMALAETDVVAPTYRNHAWVLARGVPVSAAFAELLGKEPGCCRGRAGSKHFADLSKGVLPGNAIVAGSVPIACGVALAAKLDGRRHVAVSVFGEGAMNQGALHEAMNMAAAWALPVIFLCENNLYAEMTPISNVVSVESMTERAVAYRIPARQVDGFDLEAVHDAVAEAAARAREGDGPSFLEVLTYRFCGHMPGDREHYRTKEEVERWRERDPLLTLARRLEALGFTDECEAAVNRATDEVREAETFAREAPEPSLADLALGTAEWMEVAAR